MMIDLAGLFSQARAAREKAHAPYSGFHVGAAILDESGKISCGCNVENRSFPEGTCAEGNAIGAMRIAGGSQIVAILILGGKGDLETCMPCGGCRQRIYEHSYAETCIYVGTEVNNLRMFRLAEILPDPF